MINKYGRLISALALVLSAMVLALTIVPVYANFDINKIMGQLNDASKKTVPSYMLTVTSGIGGSVNQTGGTLDGGTQVDLLATADEGYIFTGWYDGNGVYLTISPAYSLAIGSNTVLRAEFAPRPADMAAAFETEDELLDCSDKFEFSVKCDREDAKEYIRENLKIVDQYFVNEDLDAYPDSFLSEIVPEYEIEEKGDGVFVVKPAVTYTPGTTYAVCLKDTPDLSITGKTDTMDQMNFTIHKEERNVAVLRKEGIIDLSYDSIDDGDREDGIMIADISFLDGYDYSSGDTIIRITGNGKSSRYGVVTSVERMEDGRYFIGLSEPELRQIYENLDICQIGVPAASQLSSLLSDKNIEAFRRQFLSSEGFDSLVASAYEVMDEYATANGYRSMALTKFIDELNLTVTPTVNGNELRFTVDVEFTYNLGNGRALRLNYTFTDTLQVQSFVNIQLKALSDLSDTFTTFDVNETVTESASSTFSLYFDAKSETENVGTDEICRILEEKIKTNLGHTNDIQSIIADAKSILGQKGWDASSNEKQLELGTITYNFSLFSAEFDLSFFLQFDLASSLSYQQTVTKTTTNGVRLLSDRFVSYRSSGCNVQSGSLYLAGNSVLTNGIRTEFDLVMSELPKSLHVHISAEDVVRTDLSGLVCFSTTGNFTPVFAGQLSTSLTLGASSQVKLFKQSASLPLTTDTQVLFHYGYSDALLGFTYQNSNEEKTITICKDVTGLDARGLTNLLTYTTASGTFRSKALSALTLPEGFTVTYTLENGEYLTVSENGILTVRENCPARFDDILTVHITAPSPVWDTASEEVSYVSYTDDLVVRLEYDGEGYEDTEIQAQFRTLFRNYNVSNTEILKKAFRSYVDKQYVMPSVTQSAYIDLINSYVNHLFAEIDAGIATEDENHLKETAFVNTEASAFDLYRTFMDDILNEKENYQPEADEICSMLLTVSESEACRRTLGDARKTQSIVSGCRSSFEWLDKDAQNILTNTVRSFHAEFRDNSYAVEVCEGFADLFGIALD